MDSYATTEILVSALAILLVWRIGYERLRKDRFRSQIRDIRDSLFDYMLDNGHDFTMEEYKYVRDSLNGIIQMSNSLNVVTCTIGGIFSFFYPAGDETSMLRRVGDMPDSPLKKELNKALIEGGATAFYFAYFTGLTGVFVTALLKVLVVSLSILRRIFMVGATSANNTRRMKSAIQDAILVYAHSPCA